VLIAGHTNLPGVSNVILDHHLAARLTLRHLQQLGHKRIAFMHGQPISSDSETRWASMLATARELGVEIHEELKIYIAKDSHSPEIGYPGIRELIRSRRQFTAIVCFNDVSAMGSIRALHEAGLRVPEDVSVIGFDDIQSAAYQIPSLTTIRQPLERMGRTAAQLLLKRLAGEVTTDLVYVEPELIVRESTAPPKSTPATKKRPTK
jgi:LacI family transcriptional regulator